MQRLTFKKLIILTIGIITPLALTTSKVNASSFGAEIFCTMRDGGNDHESSWDAAYTYIKKQKDVKKWKKKVIENAKRKLEKNGPQSAKL